MKSAALALVAVSCGVVGCHNGCAGNSWRPSEKETEAVKVTQADRRDAGPHQMAPLVLAPIAASGQLVVATVRRNDAPGSAISHDALGIRAFSADPLAPLWSRWSGSPFVTRAGDQIYAGGRAGGLESLTSDGQERWRTALPDDRSRAGQARGDAIAPFVADVIVADDMVLTAAGSELFALARTDGSIRTRRRVCRGDGATVARLSSVGPRILVTCTALSAFDDERWTPAPLEIPPAPEVQRATPGEIVALDARLDELWRKRFELLSFGSLRPIALDGDAFACIGASVAGGAVDLFRGRLLVVSAAAGTIRWAHDIYGGLTQPEPVAVPGGVVAGVAPALFDAADGHVRWRHAAGRAPAVDARHGPVVDGQRLLYAGPPGVLLSVDLRDGTTTEALRFSKDASASVLAPPVVYDGRIYLSYRDDGGPHFSSFPLGR